jgi:hypothetical protein
MAKKAAVKKVGAVKDMTTTKPVRLDLTLADHDRLERQARRRGLNKAAYVRQALFERLEQDEKS